MGKTQKLTIGRNVLYGHMDFPQIIGAEPSWFDTSAPVELVRYTFLPEFSSAVEWECYSDNPNFTLEDVDA